MKVNKEDMLEFIDSRWWIYASSRAYDGDSLRLYFSISGFKVEKKSTVVYEGPDINAAIKHFNELEEDYV